MPRECVRVAHPYGGNTSSSVKLYADPAVSKHSQEYLPGFNRTFQSSSCTTVHTLAKLTVLISSRRGSAPLSFRPHTALAPLQP